MSFETRAFKSAGWAQLIAGLLLSVCWAISVRAQLSTGTISGTVQDPSGAVLPAAEVSATNVETGAMRAAVSGVRGEYRFPSLPVGSYEVKVSLPGFQTAIRSGVALTVGREAVLDFNLQVGSVAEQISVTGDAPLVETTSASVSGLVDSQQMREIPLNGRSFLELIPLQTGAVFAEAGGNQVMNGFGKKLSIVGTRFASNSFLLDGADINDVANISGSAAGTMTGVETVREFRVITNAYDAEYGKHTGGVISAITKSGTNDFHGSVFEFLRNDNLDARNFFDRNPRNPQKRSSPPEFRRNQLGATVGGPILRDRTFFFGSYEGLREGLGQTKTLTVPGLGMRAGFVRGVFIGVDPAIKPWLEGYPLPNTPDRPDGSAQRLVPANVNTGDNYWTARVDHRFSNSDSLFGRITKQDTKKIEPMANGFNTILNTTSLSRFATLEETHIFSSALLGRTHFSFSRTGLYSFDVVDKQFPLPMFSFDGDSFRPGVISFTGFTGWGGSGTNPKLTTQNVFQPKEDIYYTHGRHSLKFGAQFERIQYNLLSVAWSGDFYFDSPEGFLRADPNLARFNCCNPNITPDSVRGFRQNLTGLYIHDDFGVKPGLTLNIGLRYEFINTPKEVNGKVATIRDATEPHINTVTPHTTDLGDPFFLNPSLKNFAPRVGFAWDPFKKGKTSVRGGIGAFHDQVLPYLFTVSGVRVPPYYLYADLQPQVIHQKIDFPNAIRTQRDLLAGPTGLPSIDDLEFGLKQPTVYKWSFDLQQQVMASTTIEVGYSGTRGLHLLRSNNQMNVTPSEIRNGRRYILIDKNPGNPTFARMRFATSDATSIYNGLRVALNNQFRRNMQFQVSYTWSKSIDDSSSWIGSTDFGSADRAGYGREKERGLSAFDVRQSFYTNYIYNLPGRNLSGAAGVLLGGWSTSGVLRLNTGYPLSLSGGQPRSGARQMQFVSGPSLDLIPDGNQNPVRPQNADQYYDPTQFRWPIPFFMGSVGRGHLITPGIANFDFNMVKDTKIAFAGEGGALQFRAEFFNLLNRANFAAPSASVFDTLGRRVSAAGQITTTRTSSRQIQLALKLIF